MRKAYQDARERAVSINRSTRGRIVVSGADRASYLHALLTNDINALKPGTGCYSAYLTPQGRMISDLWVYELGDVILLDLPDIATKDVVLAKLDQLIFSEDVQLGDVTDAFAQVAVVGPDAARIVGILVDHADTVAALPENGCLRAAIASGAAIVTRIKDAGESGFDVYVEQAQLDVVRRILTSERVEEADVETVDVLRVEAGIPLFHRDMDENTIPLEAGIEPRAISLNKGCYVGQEVIIRVLHRGHGRVAKKLTGLSMESDAVPQTGAAVMSGDREIGTVTSAVWSIALDRPIAMAYLQRDFLEAGTTVSVDGHVAIVTSLPFLTRQ